MNSSIVRYILGQVLKLEAVLMLLPCLTALIYKEKEGWWYLAVAFVCIIFGTLLTIRKPQDTVFYLKEGCVATALSWILMSVFGCFPFMLSGEIPDFSNAMFETVSGFTTTGASVLSDVESLSHASNMWRCFSHWIGGMGVLVFILAVVPLHGGSNINLMRAESPGPSVGKFVPKIKYTARILYVIYLVLTLIEMVLLIAGKMPVFDAVAISFGTAGTGGFGIKNDSMMSYSPYIQWVVTVFMILCGVNFNAYYFILLGQVKKAFKMEEVRNYFIIIFVATVIIAYEIADAAGGVGNAIRHAVFQVGSIITTTGFSTMDYDKWSMPCKTILVLLMFIGACAGSTGGGIKVSRITIMVKTVVKELNAYIHPKSIKKIKVDEKPVEHEVVRSINVYFITFVIIFCISLFLISFEGKDLITSFTAVTATINNIGPGLQQIGPTQNFGSFTPFSKWILIFNMLAGRLELFPLLILFHPTIWKQAFKYKLKNKKD